MTVFNVNSSAELYTALSNARGGDEIRLASGDYGNLDLGPKSGFDITFNSPVTITSANGSNPASFSGMGLDGVENLTFDNVEFDYEFANGDSESYRPFQIENSSNVTIRNSEFNGDLATSGDSAGVGYGSGIALRVEYSSGITVDNNEFVDWKAGAQFYKSDGITVLNNEVHEIRSDGMNFIQVQDAQIEGNYFHDFKAAANSSDHQDMIQFWKANTDEASANITIRGNVFDVGDGSRAQTILMGDSGRNDRGLYYQDIVIEDNTIYGGHHHGITVGLSDGLEINGNLVIPVKLNPNDPHNAGVSGGVTIPKINVNEDSVNVIIDGNQSVAVNGYEGQSSWSLTNHTYLQDDAPNAPGYIPDLLADRGGAPDSVPDLGPDPEPNPEPDSNPDAELAPAPEPNPEPETTPAPAPKPEFGPVDQGSLNLDDYILDLAAGGVKPEGDARIVETPYGLAVEMGGEQSHVDLGRLQQFEQQSQLAFSVDFHRDVADGSDARLVWNHKKIGLGVEDDGLYIKVAVEGSDRWQNIRVDDLGLNDTEAHNIVVIIDEDDDRLQIVLDGEVVLDRTDIDFAFSDGGGEEWGWSLGTKWGRWLDGEISDFRIEDGAPFVGEAAAPPPSNPVQPPVTSPDPEQPPVISPDPEQPPAISPDPEQPSANVSGIDDYVANFAALQQSGDLEGDIRVVETDDGVVLDMGGEKGFADLGRLEEFEQSGEIMFSVDFHRDVADGSDARLVWNHQKIGLGLQDDGLYVKVGVAGQDRWQTIRVEDVGLNDTDLHNATIILDEDEDRLQIIVDDRVVLDETNIDFDFSEGGGHEWGWSLGSKWGRWLDGEISDFRIEGDAQFVEDAPVFDEMLIS